MARKHKVWGMRPTGRERYIVAARNQREAADAMDVSLNHLRTYASETFNGEEISAAMSAPGTKILSPTQ